MFSPSSRRRSRGASVAIKAAAAGIVVGLGLTAGSAFASATITGTFSSPPSSANNNGNSSATPIDISSGAAAWAYYGYSAAPSYTAGSSTMLNTDSGNAASFTPLNFSANANQTGFSGAGGNIEVTFPGAKSSSTDFVFDQAPSAGSSTPNFYFTTNLLAASETLNVYLISFDSTSDISAVLANGGSFTATGVVLPYSPANDTNGTGTGHGYGILSLKITGGTVGETLTFTDTNNITGVSNPSFSNVGIQAANVVVPEPASMGLLGLGGLGLLMLKRRRMV